ncbi:hypothetical protein ACGFIH_13455 [Micromonospora parva]|uniref:hypothetical protein n=1 Tax=Micromonospora parva TaxID=1464048 RepID=UPI00370FF0EE
MTVQAVLLVTAVVWAVSLIRSVRLRALVYSLPLPMTLALMSTGHGVEGAQLLGVLGLNLFFIVVTVTHHWLRWPILLADAAGIAAYVAFSAVLLAVPVPFGLALAGSVTLWGLAMLLLRRHRPAASPEPSGPLAAQGRRMPAPVKLLVILVGATLTVLLGEVLRAMVVTFPYSGVLVAVEGRRDLVAFTRHFARNSLALVGFLAAYHWWQDHSTVAALLAGWLAFAMLAVALHASTSLGVVRRRAVPGV